MHNVDRVIEYIISNAGKLNSDKIEALSKVISALGGENQVSHEPNTLPIVEDQNELMLDTLDSLADVEGIQIDGGPVRKVKILKS